MKKYSKLKTALAVAIMSFSMINTVIAADAPIELKGDVIEYNAQTDMAIATGGVTIIRDGGVLTGGQATYNFKTQEASITGGVTANKDDMNLKAESLISNANKEVVAKVKNLIGLTILKFHDIVVMRGMIMNETSDMDNQKLEMIKQYISKKEISETNVLKNDILEKIDEHFTKKLECVNGDWKNKDNGLSKLIKDNFVFSADYKIQTLGWILNKLSLEDFSECYKDEIINLRNKFAHATLLEEKDENEKVIRKYFKHGDSGITFDEALCKTIRTNITKHKKNLRILKNKIDE